MAGDGQEPRLGDGREFGFPLGQAQRVADAPLLGDVDEGDDDAFDALLMGSIRQDATDEPGAATGLDFALDRRTRFQHGARVVQQHAVGRQRIEIRERPADIARYHPEQRSCGQHEEADVQLRIEEHRRDIGAVEHVLQVVGGRSLPLQRFLELAVERGQFLVQRLQFLLRRKQLLVGRLELLVDRQRLLVDGLLLFARNLEIADGALQLDLVTSSSRCSRAIAGSSRATAGSASSAGPLGSSTKQTSNSSSPSLDRPNVDAERNPGIVMREMAAGEHDPPVRLQSLVDCRSELRPDLAPRQGKQIPGVGNPPPRSGSVPSPRAYRGSRAGG